MNKIRTKNELIKRKYFDVCRGVKGYSEKTIKVKEKALWKYEEFTKYADFKDFDSNKAKSFKKWLSVIKSKQTDKPLELTTRYHILRNLNDFFSWLSQQQGYKSKVHIDDVGFLRLSREETKIATISKQPKYPTLPAILRLCSFPVENDIDLRDRALIAFTALSGMRDNAIITLPLECFIPEELQVLQDPSHGVKTKYSKFINTTLFNFDQKLVNYVLDWHSHLINKLFFNNTNPFFPSTNVEIESKTHQSFIVKGVTKEFWKDASSMRRIFKERSMQMELDYYSPHKFRHFAARQASDMAKTPEQFKAVSQNLGHEHLQTTFSSYGAIDPMRLKKVISDLGNKKAN